MKYEKNFIKKPRLSFFWVTLILLSAAWCARADVSSSTEMKAVDIFFQHVYHKRYAQALDRVKSEVLVFNEAQKYQVMSIIVDHLAQKRMALAKIVRVKMVSGVISRQTTWHEKTIRSLNRRRMIFLLVAGCLGLVSGGSAVAAGHEIMVIAHKMRSMKSLFELSIGDVVSFFADNSLHATLGVVLWMGSAIACFATLVEGMQTHYELQDIEILVDEIKFLEELTVCLA